MATPITITGTLQDPTGAVVANGLVTFSLENYGDNVPMVVGTTIIVAQNVQTQSGSNGTFSIQLWGNDQISPGSGDIPPVTYYTATFATSNGRIIGAASYQFTGSAAIDLNSATPIIVNPQPQQPIQQNITQLIINNWATSIVSFSNKGPGNVTIAHGLGRVPTFAIPFITGLAIIGWQNPKWDGVNLYPIFSDSNISGSFWVV